MNQKTIDITKVISYLLVALIAFLIGWIGKSWKDRKKIRKQVNQEIKRLNAEQKKALETLRKTRWRN